MTTTATTARNYAAKATITIGLAATPLATSATFIAGRQSTALDNTANKYDDVLVRGKVTVGTTPTVSTNILVFVYASTDDSAPTYPDTITGSDGDVSITSVGVLRGALVLGAVLTVDATTSNRTYYAKPFSVAQMFGGQMPKFWGLFVAHNTGVALNATAANHAFDYVGIKTDIVSP